MSVNENLTCAHNPMHTMYEISRAYLQTSKGELCGYTLPTTCRHNIIAMGSVSVSQNSVCSCLKAVHCWQWQTHRILLLSPMARLPTSIILLHGIMDQLHILAIIVYAEFEWSFQCMYNWCACTGIDFPRTSLLTSDLYLGLWMTEPSQNMLEE